MTEQANRNHTTRAAGILLLGLSALSLLFIAHHPTLGAPGYETLALEAVAEAGLNSMVHGVLIVITAGFYLCLSVFADRLGGGYVVVRAGKISLAAATITMIGAALVSGFIVPETARTLVSAGDAASFEPLLCMLGAANQTLATAGVFAYGAMMAFWAARLAWIAGFARICAAAGLIAGIVLAGGVASERLVLDVEGMTLALAIMSAWFVLVAFMLIRNDLQG